MPQKNKSRRNKVDPNAPGELLIRRIKEVQFKAMSGRHGNAFTAISITDGQMRERKPPTKSIIEPRSTLDSYIDRVSYMRCEYEKDMSYCYNNNSKSPNLKLTTNNTELDIRIPRKPRLDDEKLRTNENENDNPSLSQNGTTVDNNCIYESPDIILEKEKIEPSEPPSDARFNLDGDGNTDVVQNIKFKSDNTLNCIPENNNNMTEPSFTEYGSVYGRHRRSMNASEYYRKKSWIKKMTLEAKNERKTSQQQLEDNDFNEWRYNMHLLEKSGVTLTPYEKNINYWRELWKVLEISDIVVQVVDARDPSLFYCDDVYRYFVELRSKRLIGVSENQNVTPNVIILNKADLVPKKVITNYIKWFQKRGIIALPFSGLVSMEEKETNDDNQEFIDITLTEDLRSGLVISDKNEEKEKEGTQYLGVDRLIENLLHIVEYTNRRIKITRSDNTKGSIGTVGFVGFPNVGKSTVINAIYGSKKVSMSRQPGKTKHAQTLHMDITAFSIHLKDFVPEGCSQGGNHRIEQKYMILCDCPGLVFPSTTISRSHLIISGVVPLSIVRSRGHRDESIFHCADLIITNVGESLLMEIYGIADIISSSKIRVSILQGICIKHKKFLRLLVPDETYAARLLVIDYIEGKIPHHEILSGESKEDNDINASNCIPERNGEQIETKKELYKKNNPLDIENAVDHFRKYMKDIEQTDEVPHWKTKRAYRMDMKRMSKGGCITLPNS